MEFTTEIQRNPPQFPTIVSVLKEVLMFMKNWSPTPCEQAGQMLKAEILQFILKMKT